MVHDKSFDLGGYGVCFKHSRKQVAEYDPLLCSFFFRRSKCKSKWCDHSQSYFISNIQFVVFSEFYGKIITLEQAMCIGEIFIKTIFVS